jgi:hypothetical protein
VILDGYSVEQAKDLIEAARIAIGEREVHFEDKRLRVAASAGVAELAEGESTEQWLQRADDAMYQSKNAGRDCAHWMDGTDPIRIELDGPIGIAARNGQARPAAKPAAENAADNVAGPQLGQASDANESPAARKTAKNDVEEVDLNLVPAKAETSSKADPSAFAYLPDRETLGVSFAEFRGRTQSSVSFYVMAIRCNECGHCFRLFVRRSVRSIASVVMTIQPSWCACRVWMRRQHSNEGNRSAARLKRLGTAKPTVKTIRLPSASPRRGQMKNSPLPFHAPLS